MPGDILFFGNKPFWKVEVVVCLISLFLSLASSAVYFGFKPNAGGFVYPCIIFFIFAIPVGVDAFISRKKFVEYELRREREDMALARFMRRQNFLAAVRRPYQDYQEMQHVDYEESVELNLPPPPIEEANIEIPLNDQ